MKFPKPKKTKKKKGASFQKEFIRVSKRIKERDENSCKLCELFGVYQTPCSDVHHINFRSAGGTNDEENLICLCRFHHMQAHGINTGEMGKEYYAGTEKEIREKLKQIIRGIYGK